VTVCGRVAEDGFYAYFSCADGGPVTNASLGLLERVRRKSEPHR